MAYLVVIFGFMGLYLLNADGAASHLSWDEALVLSVSSFHGRGFFLQNVALGDTFARLAAVEAVLGLLIEIGFIATFTQRFLGRGGGKRITAMRAKNLKGLVCQKSSRNAIATKSFFLLNLVLRSLNPVLPT